MGRLSLVHYTGRELRLLELERLGQELRERRERLRISRAELSRRVGLSPTYTWLIEQASPRDRGRPTRPSEDVLRRWTRALGMEEGETRRTLNLAGYFDDFASLQTTGSDEDTLMSFAPGEETTGELRGIGPVGMPVESFDERSFFRPDGTIRPDIERLFTESLRSLLREARRKGRSDQVLRLLDSYLRWLEFAIRLNERF